MNYCQSSSPIADSLNMILTNPLAAQSYCSRRDTQYSGNKQSVSCSQEYHSVASPNTQQTSYASTNAPPSSYQTTSAFWNNSAVKCK